MEFIEKVRDMDDEERDALWAEFSEFSNLLWVIKASLIYIIVRQNYDGNAAIVGQDFEIDLGGRTRYNDDEDKAEDPLFSSVSEDLINRKTYYTFMRLMDNYSRKRF